MIMREGLFWGSELRTSTSDADVDLEFSYGPRIHARYPGVSYLISGVFTGTKRGGLCFGENWDGGQELAG